jgi:hypothetical protein
MTIKANRLGPTIGLLAACILAVFYFFKKNPSNENKLDDERPSLGEDDERLSWEENSDVAVERLSSDNSVGGSRNKRRRSRKTRITKKTKKSRKGRVRRRTNKR